jgi:hypothetical protein
MNDVKTVFEVKGETYSVQGCGQEATSAIIARFPITRIFILGFLINNKFCPVNYEE